MEKLASRNGAMVLDVLSARLAFERTGVQLYDGVIHKIRVHGEERYQSLVDVLAHHRDEEQEHADWLASVIQQLGGHPDDRGDMAALEAEESLGIQQVIIDGHTKIPHLLHALLAAELADNAGWDLLVKLADEAGDRAAKAEFARRMAEEVKHLAFVREAVVRAAEIEILGEDVELPSHEVSAFKKPLAIGAMIAGAIGVAGIVSGIVLSRRGQLRFA